VSTITPRGAVQPLLALAVRLRTQRHEVLVCALANVLRSGVPRGSLERALDAATTARPVGERIVIDGARSPPSGR